MEQWRPVINYEAHYEVSDHGRVRSIERKVWFTNRWGQRIQRTVPPKLRKLSAHKNGGHLYVKLHNGAERKPFFVHRLVLENFVGPCPDGWQCRHLDGDPTNNHVSNLKWGTPSENTIDAVRHGTNHHARKTHCKRGHEFTRDNTYQRPDGKGRQCWECMKEYTRKNGARHQRDYRVRQRSSNA